jgi:UDP-3-O-[3-hydroxymyristoyl] N-acetylglucosamine deacetylase
MNPNFLSSADSYRVQKTLQAPLSFRGIGLHTGKKTAIRCHPAPANHGIIFLKTNLKSPVRIPAHFDAVIGTQMATTLGLSDNHDVCIHTVEHLLAALFALGVTNTLIEIDGSEIPILDGSAAPFIEAIRETGLVLQTYSAPILRILKPVKVYQKGTICELLPRDRLRLTTSIDFAHPSIGPQTFALELTPKAFEEEVCNARTFGFYSDVERLRKNNLALGADLSNVLAFSEDGVVNKEGMRFTDECVRHKLLDAVGDLALCGAWIEGELVSFRGGHHIHYKLLKALSQFPNHWELIKASPLVNPVITNSAMKDQPQHLRN